jgi:hypothetical protein
MAIKDREQLLEILKKNKRAGFGILQVMIISVVLAVMAVLYSQIHIQEAKNISRDQAQMKASSLQTQIQAAAADPAAFYRTSVVYSSLVSSTAVMTFNSSANQQQE